MNPKYMTDASLLFVMADCLAAISAMPDNPKVRQYLNEYEACKSELGLRETKRALRSAKNYVRDYLKLSLLQRRFERRCNSAYIEHTNKRAQEASWTLGYMRIH